MPFRFLHLADLHLETSFGGRPGTRARLRRATAEAFERAIDYALDQQLHAVLAAGDLYDDAVLSPRVELELVRQVRRLEEAGIWFLAACGNHDPGGSQFRAARLGLGGGRVHLFRGLEPEVVEVTDARGEPVGQVVGAGHPTSTCHDDLAARFPAPAGELPVVGLLHTHLEGTRQAAAHGRYAPSVRADYERLGYAYWALGHIHRRQRALEGLPVFYAGNLQGRNPREPGPKGGLVVEARAGLFAEPEFVRFAPVRWERLRVDDLPAADELEGLVEHVARRVDALRASAGQELICVLELAGPTPVAPRLRSETVLRELEAELESRTGVLEIQLRAREARLPLDRSALRAAPTVLAQALRLIERARHDDALLETLAPDVLASPEGSDPARRAAYLRALLADLEDDVVERSRLPEGA